ncbi:MAG TPA: GAF domain-containing protein [Solirubrobacterales bacterium]|nr:GAF domain-containing protein [Solirubrobacterales bacterium]
MPSIRGVIENALGGVVAAVLLGAAVWGISHIDAPLALWIVFLIGAAMLIVGFGLGRSSRYGDDLLGYQSDLLADAMLALRQVATGQLSTSFEEFIERGILGPARFGLSAERGEEIRISVLELDEAGENFCMIFESGHSFGRKQAFSLRRASMAGHALETGELQWTNDVEGDDRWHAHPKANAARSYGSLACMPIVVNDEPVAVLNVLSSARGAFLKSDLTYIELLGGFIGLAWTMVNDAGPSHRLRLSQEPQARDRKET